LARSSKSNTFTNANQYEEEEKLPSPPPLPLSHQVLSTPSALLGTSPGGFPCFTHSLSGGGKYGGSGGSPTANDFSTMLPPPLSTISSSMSGSGSGMQQYSMPTDVQRVSICCYDNTNDRMKFSLIWSKSLLLSTESDTGRIYCRLPVKHSFLEYILPSSNI